ncbi:uncharacterized protein LOC144435055 [Glandiceps talaboti]
MILMSLLALTKRLIVRPFTEALTRATVFTEKRKHDKDDTTHKESGNKKKMVRRSETGDVALAVKTRMKTSHGTPPIKKESLSLRVTDSRREMMFLTKGAGICLTCVCDGFLPSKKIKRTLSRCFMTFFVITVITLTSCTIWLLLQQRQVWCQARQDDPNAFCDTDINKFERDMPSLWSLGPTADDVNFKKGTLPATAQYSYPNLETSLLKFVFNTPGELHIIRLYNEFENVILNTAKKHELKGLVFNLASHQSLKHSIAYTILPYHPSHTTSSLALRSSYLLSWERSEMSAIFNEMVHQSLLLTQYLSSEGIDVLLDAFQSTVTEYSARYTDASSRLHIFIQKPEVLMKDEVTGDEKEIVFKFLKVLLALVEKCEITLVVLPHGREFTEWMDDITAIDSFAVDDTKKWYIGEPIYNDTITWLNGEYGSILTRKDTKMILDNIGSNRKQISRIVQKVIQGQKVKDVINTYKDNALLQFTTKMRKMKHPGLLYHLFQDFSQSHPPCYELSMMTAMENYGSEFVLGLQKARMIFSQHGNSLYGNCGSNTFRPVHKYLIGFREFEKKQLTVLSIQVVDGDEVYHVNLQELTVLHLMTKLEDYGINTSSIDHFSVNNSEWHYGNIYSKSDHVMRYLNTGTTLHMKYKVLEDVIGRPSSDQGESSTEQGWMDWLIPGSDGDQTQQGLIGWVVSFVW